MRPAVPARRLRLITLLAFLGFFAAGAGWAIAMPWDGGPDEQSHITRAAGVVDGQLTPSPIYLPVPDLPRPLAGSNQTIPGGVARPSPPCFAFKAEQPANCVHEDSRPPHEPVEQFTAGAGRYQPTYYALVGWPLRWWPGEGGLLAARLLSAALSAAFLAAAVYSVLAWSRRPFLLVGLLVAATPMALHLAGVINANGLQISAAIAMWTALIPLVLGEAPLDRRLLILAGVSAVTLAWTRPDGPMTVALAFTILTATAGRARLAVLARSRGAWILGSAAIVACVLSGIWTLAMKATELVPVPGGAGLGPRDALQLVVVDRTSFYLKSMIGQFGWVDVGMPDAYYAIWFAATGFLVVAALAAGRRGDRWRLALVIAGAFALPLWMDVMGAEENGMMAQGRYILPTAAGRRDPRRVRRRRPRALPRAVRAFGGPLADRVPAARASHRPGVHDDPLPARSPRPRPGREPVFRRVVPAPGLGHRAERRGGGTRITGRDGLAGHHREEHGDRGRPDTERRIRQCRTTSRQWRCTRTRGERSSNLTRDWRTSSIRTRRSTSRSRAAITPT
ncbi:DUF2142 domain-containing protein [Actinomadura madurae]|uniref:DUF2142 domain-containing protein n=1 Tax=Actinomadura madurae TaxID=1993 RepID=UPI0020D25D38|nr:DUF2142 domain-containing protein [Actinomadura madurae]MCQ0008460.1 DUF2142 domain-containing protein [Actinomadura madurae]